MEVPSGLRLRTAADLLPSLVHRTLGWVFADTTCLIHPDHAVNLLLFLTTHQCIGCGFLVALRSNFPFLRIDAVVDFLELGDLLRIDSICLLEEAPTQATFVASGRRATVRTGIHAFTMTLIEST